MDHAAALTIRGLSKEYTRGKPVLIGISLEFAARGVTAVIGPSAQWRSA